MNQSTALGKDRHQKFMIQGDGAGRIAFNLLANHIKYQTMTKTVQ
ncbi:hypothetical protein SDC9_201025 [bioreactor metagenome]|uniref:Uncharacterized protein n=1 Tax=bioreactor metagenome TaxID=1076179 RepID=A0A645IPV7_9ZZZZ